jgi:hypothetical protein
MTTNKLHGFLGGFVGGAVQDIAQSILKMLTEQGGETIKKKIEKIQKQTSPADFIKTFASLNKESIDKLVFLFKEAREDHRESELALLLAATLPTKEDGTLDSAEAKKALYELTQTDAESLSLVIESMAKNNFRKQMKEVLSSFNKFLEKSLIEAATTAGYLAGAIIALDKKAEEKAKEMDSHGFGWLAKKLFR